MEKKRVLPKGKGRADEKRVPHKCYKGGDIRSSPFEGLQIKGSARRKVRTDIALPYGDGRKTISEYLDEKQRYLTQ